MSVLRDIGAALVWLVVALVVAVGAAGIVSAVGGAPGTAARAELTWAGDQELRGGIAGATGRLADLSNEIDALGEKGRLALTHIAVPDVAGAQSIIDEGSPIAERIGTMAADLRSATSTLPGIESQAGLRYSPEVVAQRTFLAAATAATADVEETWVRFTVAATAAEGLAARLLNHDQQTGAAAKLASGAKYADALKKLDESDATMAEISALHEKLAAAADTTVLAAWIERSTAYDATVRKLWEEMVKSKGVLTPAARALLVDEGRARALLPSNTKALTVIMGEVAQAGLQQAVISIEEARIQVDDIIAKLDAEA